MPATIKFDRRQLDKLSEALKGSPKEIKSNLRVAVNNTLKWTGTQAARVVSQELTAKVGVLKKALRPKRAKGNDLTAVLTVKKEKKLPLKEFKATHVKKGVSYKISKREGKKLLPSAFMGGKPGKKTARWNGNVLMRMGKEKIPIQVKYGVSPWGVYVKSGKDKSIRRETKAQLRKEIERRIKFIQLKQSGEIK